jgi:hypothetical protein
MNSKLLAIVTERSATMPRTENAASTIAAAA